MTSRLLGNFSSLFLVLISSTLFSCAGMRKFQEDTSMARDRDKKAFVETADGTITEANEAVVRTPFLGKSTIELDKNTKIPVKEVVAYQNDKAYYRKIQGQFAPRIKKGLINMYMTTESYTEYQGPTMGNPGGFKTRHRTIYYLQKGGDQASTNRFTPQLTKEYVQDYAPAMEFINVYDNNARKARIWSIVNTAAVAGGALLMITSGTSSQAESSVSAAGYAGAGLFFGGLVSGVVNKIRKGKNVRNLELAIDEYNAQTRKRNRR
jgi:hypothetical protein